jgi:hypothetical protein
MRSSSATVQQKVRASSKQAVWLIRARLGRRWIWVECGRATQVPRRRKGEPGLSLAASGRFCGGKPSFQTFPVMKLLHANETRRDVCITFERPQLQRMRFLRCVSTATRSLFAANSNSTLQLAVLSFSKPAAHAGTLVAH